MGKISLILKISESEYDKLYNGINKQTTANLTMEADESAGERKPSGRNESLPPEVDVQCERSSKSLITIEPIVFVTFFAAGLSGAVTVNFVSTRTCEIYFHYNESFCNKLGSAIGNQSYEEAVQQHAAVILTGMNFLSQILPALMCLFVGPWSDYNGRKMVLVIPALGHFFKYTLIFILCFFPNLGPEYVLVAAIPESLLGGMVNFVTAGFAYVSDLSNEDNQSVRISFFECVIYLGSIAGLFSSSYLYKAGGTHGFMLIYGISALVLILAIVPTHIFVPESVPVVEGKGLLHVFELKLLKEMFRACFEKRNDYKRTVIFLVIFCLTVTISCALGEENVLFFFMKIRFGWGVREFTLWQFVSLAIAFLGVSSGTLILTKWLKVPDAVLGIIAYMMKTANSFYLAFVPSDAPQLIFYSGLIHPFGGLCGAAGRTLLSKSVPKEDLGKIFAMAGAFEAIVPLMFAPLYTFLYSLTLKTFPSAFLLLSGSLYILCCVLYMIIYFVTRRRNPVEYERMENEREDENEALVDSSE